MQVEFAEAEKQLFRPESVAPWFSADVRLGSLCLHLEPPSCFSAGALSFFFTVYKQKALCISVLCYH